MDTKLVWKIGILYFSVLFYQTFTKNIKWKKMQNRKTRRMFSWRKSMMVALLNVPWNIYYHSEAFQFNIKKNKPLQCHFHLLIAFLATKNFGITKMKEEFMTDIWYTYKYHNWHACIYMFIHIHTYIHT